MRNVKSKVLALMIAVCACKAGMLAAECPMKAQHHLLAKSHEKNEVSHALLIRYTPVSQEAGGTYQVGILDASGKLHMDEKNKRIDILNPGGPRHFRIKGPLPAGTYQIVVYVKERSDSAPVNLTNLIQDIQIVTGSHRAFIDSFNDPLFQGNAASTREREQAFKTFALFDPKEQAE